MSGKTEKTRILLVDDDPETRRVVTEALGEDFSVTVAKDGARGWELARTEPVPDLLLLEVDLPALDGLELCRRAKSDQATREVCALFLSRRNDPAIQMQALQAGAADFLAKPLHPALLKKRIAQHLELRALGKGKKERWAVPAEAPEKGQIDRLNAKLQRHREAMEQLSQEFQTFCYAVSHDLRAPLRHMIGFSEALIEDYHDKFEGNASLYLDCIDKAGRKMESLLDALLALSRIGSQEMTLSYVDLSTLATECADALRSSAPHRRVKFEIEPGLAARGDLALLRTALNHLLQNAWKFTAQKEEGRIAVGKREGEGGTVFFVRDNGAGFDPKYAGRLFGPFQRLHQEKEYEGVGIGLATVQRIIRRHGGKVWAESTLDGGATFYFTLPA